MKGPTRFPMLLVLAGAVLVAPAAYAQHADMFGKMDSDGNGRISAAEHATAAAAMFDKADANHDGSLDAEEMHAMHAMHAGTAGHTMAKAGKMGCDCCAEGDGKMSCGVKDKADPISAAMDGHAHHPEE